MLSSEVAVTYLPRKEQRPWQTQMAAWHCEN